MIMKTEGKNNGGEHTGRRKPKKLVAKYDDKTY